MSILTAEGVSTRVGGGSSAINQRRSLQKLTQTPREASSTSSDPRPSWMHLKFVSYRATNCCKRDLDHSISRNWMNSPGLFPKACLLRLNNFHARINHSDVNPTTLKVKGTVRTWQHRGSSSLSRHDVLLRMLIVQFARTIIFLRKQPNFYHFFLLLLLFHIRVMRNVI